ncbi:hypothetical protein MVEN_00503600 [Mycena venus]|uniref:Uncharacterized protein n=1 Tax=Mycena venus TaxID=2733690 RepID=A0A8H6YM91_9AGAR|nr:hypothetical protein MVEN_00503600 [Mycena venus]
MTDSPPSCSILLRSVVVTKTAHCLAHALTGRECQSSDWNSHKRACAAAPKWYDKHRRCRDGTSHEGRLELITWDFPQDGMGWGNCAAEDSEDMKKKFETEFGGDEENLFKYWPQAFRWTCCGRLLDVLGCAVLTCFFFLIVDPVLAITAGWGEPLPASIFNEKTASRHGLTLSRGPDPRSKRW